MVLPHGSYFNDAVVVVMAPSGALESDVTDRDGRSIARRTIGENAGVLFLARDGTTDQGLSGRAFRVAFLDAMGEVVSARPWPRQIRSWVPGFAVLSKKANEDRVWSGDDEGPFDHLFVSASQLTSEEFRTACGGKPARADWTFVARVWDRNGSVRVGAPYFGGYDAEGWTDDLMKQATVERSRSKAPPCF